MKKQVSKPKALIDIKALMGDTSDNYPGVKGIGEKTAYKLIKEYSKLIDRLLENIGLLTKGQQRKNKRRFREIWRCREFLRKFNAMCRFPAHWKTLYFTLQHDRAEEMLRLHQIGELSRC